MREQRRTPDPERQRTGRLGALTVHARGRTNTRPARIAWERAVAAEFSIADDLSAAERQKRLDAALRVKMTRLAMLRWNKKGADSNHRADAPEADRASDPTATPRS